MNVHDNELVRMVTFKLGDTARRLGMLAKEVEAPHLRQLLMASATAFSEHAQELRVAVKNSERKPLAPLARDRSA